MPSATTNEPHHLAIPSAVAGLLTCLLALTAPLPGQPTASLYPSPYRIDLVPAPDFRGLEGTVYLRWAPSPFGVAVTAAGELLYEPEIHIEELPRPGGLGPYTAYVAWATTPLLDPVVKLGAVRAGANHFGAGGRIGFDRFLILISAEANADVEQREGPLVLRGMSPSMAMMPDNHLMLPSIPAAPADRRGDSGHSDHGGTPALTDAWPHHPHRPDIAMMPGFEDLRPPATPYHPEAALDAAPDATPPEARPREIVRLQSGQTLDLVAAPVRRQVGGRTLTMYGFNGQYPGPLIEVDAGATIVVRFHNRTRLPTTVHWHGLRLDNAYDGVPGLTQDPVQPGDTFTYHVHFPDAGIYWYHPHHREDVLQDMGLYGNMLVRPAEPESWPGDIHREETLVLDDLLVTDEGLFPWGEETATHALMGRFGNLLLVNGEPEYRLAVTRGEVVRFFLTNVSNTRTFNLSFSGARIKLIASDLGLYEHASWVESVLIAPAERYVVDVRFEMQGRVALRHRARAVEHTFGRFLEIDDELGAIEVGAEPARPDLGAAFELLHHATAVSADIDAVLGDRAHAFERAPDLELLFTLELDGLQPTVMQRMQLDRVYFHPIEWAGTMPMMNWLTTARQASWILRDGHGRENDAIEWRFEVGESVKIRLRNDRDAVHAMQHPFHIHGQRFLVLAHNGVRNHNLVFKDTVLLPVGSETDILLELSNPGQWMAHCHIAEHLEAGMKMTMTVAAGEKETLGPRKTRPVPENR